MGDFENFHPVLSLLSYLLKAPLVPPGTPIVNALFAQKQALVNIFRACVALPPENNMLLEHRLPSYVKEVHQHQIKKGVKRAVTTDHNFDMVPAEKKPRANRSNPEEMKTKVFKRECHIRKVSLFYLWEI